MFKQGKLLTFKLSDAKLEKAGYSIVPSHAYAKRFYIQEWITGKGWQKNNFPRFHIVVENGKKYIHLDEASANGGHGVSSTTSEALYKEINRLKNL